MIHETLLYIGIAFLGAVGLIIVSKFILQGIIRMRPDFYEAAEAEEERALIEAMNKHREEHAAVHMPAETEEPAAEIEESVEPEPEIEEPVDEADVEVEPEPEIEEPVDEADVEVEPEPEIEEPAEYNDSDDDASDVEASDEIVYIIEEPGVIEDEEEAPEPETVETEEAPESEPEPEPVEPEPVEPEPEPEPVEPEETTGLPEPEEVPVPAGNMDMEAKRAAAKARAEAKRQAAMERKARAKLNPSEFRELPKPSMKMKKKELLSAARDRGIDVPDKATKIQILDLIEEADNK